MTDQVSSTFPSTGIVSHIANLKFNVFIISVGFGKNGYHHNKGSAQAGVPSKTFIATYHDRVQH